MPKIIAHYQAENEPGGADRALQRTADLRFSDTRVVAHRDFKHAESSQGPFEDHLNRPTVGGLFEHERAQYVGASGAKWAEIPNVYSIEKPDQAGGQTIPKHLMPRQRSSRTLPLQAGTERDVRTPLRDWRQENWQFGWTIAVVAIQEHDHVGGICRGQTGKARSPIAAARFVNDAGSHSRGDLRRPVIRIAVNNDDLRREVGRQIRQDALNRLRFIMGRDDDGHSHRASD